MTIIHRVFSTAFHHRPEAHRWGIQASAVSEVRPDRVTSQITSAPWEGLYLEVDDEVDNVVADGIPTGPELDRFLATLMYGE